MNEDQERAAQLARLERWRELCKLTKPRLIVEVEKAKLAAGLHTIYQAAPYSKWRKEELANECIRFEAMKR